MHKMLVNQQKELPRRKERIDIGRYAIIQYGHSLVFGVGTVLLALLLPIFTEIRFDMTGTCSLILFYFFNILGITLGFHRLAAHRSFSASNVLKSFLWIAGSMACQGPLIYWVSNHRCHHKNSDKPGDPHSPVINGSNRLNRLTGFIHAHIGWTFQSRVCNPLSFSRDLYKEKLAVFVNQYYLLWMTIGLLLPGVLGFLISGSLDGALMALYWGTIVRLALSYHATNAINSVTHMVGKRVFQTRDNSHNIWMLAIPTLGEGWHNNHHAFPASAKFGLHWYQFDIGWLCLRLFKTLGLVSQIKTPSAKKIAQVRNKIKYEKMDRL